MTLFGNKVSADIVKMTSLGWALIQHNVDACKKREIRTETQADMKNTLWRHTDSEGRQTREDEGRDCSCAATNQGTESRKEGAQPCQHLDFKLLASRTVREQISVVLSHQVCGTWLWQPRETNAPG